MKSWVWLAMLAICGVALGPSISRAVLAAAPAPVMAHDMTSMHHMHAMPGMHAVPADEALVDSVADSRVDSPPSGHGAEHAQCVLDCCALCAVAALPFTSPSWPATIGLPAASAAAPEAGDAGVPLRRRALWSRATPRGPPAGA